MRSNTKLFTLLKNNQKKLNQKIQIFKNNFVFSTFCLFLGFMCGNLFGTFLNFFRSFIHWDGTIIALTLLMIEWINYLNFSFLKSKTSLMPLTPTLTKPRFGPFWLIIKTFHSILSLPSPPPLGGRQGKARQKDKKKRNFFFPRFFHLILDKEKPNENQKHQKHSSIHESLSSEDGTTQVILPIKTSHRFDSKFLLMIRFLNFYKIGLLLGFFIDAFKVGS